MGWQIDRLAEESLIRCPRAQWLITRGEEEWTLMWGLALGGDQNKMESVMFTIISQHFYINLNYDF